MLFGKIFYMIHRTISVSFLRDTIRGDEDINLRVPSFMPQKGQVSKAKACVDRHVGRPPRDDGKRATSSR